MESWTTIRTVVDTALILLEDPGLEEVRISLSGDEIKRLYVMLGSILGVLDDYDAAQPTATISSSKLRG